MTKTIDTKTMTRSRAMRMLKAWLRDNDSPAKGFKYIGEGSYRVVFKGPDKNVYKMPAYTYDKDSLEANLEEYENYLQIAELPEFKWHGRKWIVAPMQLFQFPELGSVYGYAMNVIVAPFIKHDHWLDACEDGCIKDDYNTDFYNCVEYAMACKHFGLEDILDSNVAVLRDGTRVILDAQL